MDDSERWLKDVSARLAKLKGRLSLPETKEYQVERLERLVARIGAFGPACPGCASLREQVEKLLGLLARAPLNRAQNQSYLFAMGQLISHLKKEHHLVNEGENLGYGMVIGLFAGATLALVVKSILATLGGLVLGSAVGAWLDARARRAGRVI